ncbi:class I SAM-dependent methyltransferase [Pseudonocardia sp. DLS-67]
MYYQGRSLENTHAGAQHFVRAVRRKARSSQPPRILVAGCGKGHEARYIHDELGGELVGIDIDAAWETENYPDIPGFELQRGSVLDMPFSGDDFDMVFYHHVIEHVADPARSLSELARVLRPGGLLYLATPNRNRAIGYIGSYDATWKQKLRWNAIDLGKRLRGRFRNELGAHAGFSQNELAELLRGQFREAEFLTGDYLMFKYGSRIPQQVMKVIGSRPVRELLAPGVYVVAQR